MMHPTRSTDASDGAHDEAASHPFGAHFIAGLGLLSLSGDDADNTATVSRDAAGAILVDGGAVHITGGTPTVANTAVIQAAGGGGDDVITLDEANGALPAALLFGGAGNDSLSGGSGADLLFGQSGSDSLFGKAGDDLLFGGSGNDVLVGGAGSDQLFGEAGDDRMIWNPGDGSDLLEGGSGIDTAQVNGGNGAETFTVAANGARVRLDRVSPAPFSLDIGTTEHLLVNLNGGDDSFTAGNGLASLIQLTVDGGAGNDAINGGDGNDQLLGGTGNDLITGGRGNDAAQLGDGDDVFVWNPGDGSDVVEGGAGNDISVFNGANIAEDIVISANGERVQLTRDVGAVTMDHDGVERIDVAARGGSDHLVVGDLGVTDATQIDIDLGLNGAGDAAADGVEVNGSKADDQIGVAGSAGAATVTGLHATVALAGAESIDALSVFAGDGNDVLNASNLSSDLHLTLDGGAGNDTIVGGQGADMLIGGGGDDAVAGGRGNDVAQLGDGDDTFTWNPGDASDSVEGQAGSDRLIFNGANIDEKIDIAANGDRVRLTRDVGVVTMDVHGVETIDVNARAGIDLIDVHDLSGTEAAQVDLDLAATPGSAGADGANDIVTIEGTGGDDVIQLSMQGGDLVIDGLAARIVIQNFDATDQIHVLGLGGDDVLQASFVQATGPQLLLDGGDGNDVLLGGDGNDLLFGGLGDDVLVGGLGQDVLDGGPGDNTLLQ